LLSEISYVDLQETKNPDGSYNKSKIVIALTSKGFSSAQALDYVNHWRVVDHQPNTTSGFSATLFEKLDDNQTGTGEYTLAFRGTEGVSDFGVDLVEDIFCLSAQGIARHQAADLYRYYKRLTTPEGQSVEYSVSELLLLTAFETGSFDPLTTSAAYLAMVVKTVSAKESALLLANGFHVPRQ
jgi:hypothetical protein